MNLPQTIHTPLEVPLRHVIFDLDGTLADSEHASFKAYAVALREATGCTKLRADVLSRLGVGRGWHEILPRVKDRYEEQGQQFRDSIDAIAGSPDAMADFKAEITAKSLQAIQNDMAEMPFIKRVLNQLAQQDVGFSIVTSATPDRVELILNKLKLASYFSADSIICNDGSYTAEQKKPHPQMYLDRLAKLESMGIDRNAVIAFEDSPAGVEAAVRAGVPVVGVAAASHIAKNLKAQHCAELMRLGAFTGISNWREAQPLLDQLIQPEMFDAGLADKAPVRAASRSVKPSGKRSGVARPI